MFKKLFTNEFTLDPYHQFAGVLFKTAADPNSPLNPFSEASEQTRQASIQLFQKLVDNSKTHVPRDLREELPYLLWVYHMGIILFGSTILLPNINVRFASSI